MTSTSCCGIGGGQSYMAGTAASGARAVRRVVSTVARRPQRPPDLVERHHAAQHAVAVDGHHRAQAVQPLGAQQRLERLVDRDLSGLGSRAITSSTVEPGPQRLRHLLDALERDEPDEVAGRVGDREPRPAVAPEELVERAVELRSAPARRPARRPSRRTRAARRAARPTRRDQTSSARAACAMNSAMKISQMPTKYRPRSATIEVQAERRDHVGDAAAERAASRVARARSPVRHQASASAIRPPSSGSPGIRLKASTNSVDAGDVAEHGLGGAHAGLAPRRCAADQKSSQSSTVAPSSDAEQRDRERHERPGDGDRELGAAACARAASARGRRAATARCRRPRCRCAARPARGRARAAGSTAGTAATAATASANAFVVVVRGTGRRSTPTARRSQEQERGTTAG